MHLTTFILSLVLFLPLSHAQDSIRESIDLKSGQYLIGSIVYSSWNGEALVNIRRAENHNIANFAICYAPRGATVSTSVSASDLTNCSVQKNQWFVANESSIQKFDEILSQNLEKNYQREFKRQVWDANTGNVIVFPLMAATLTGLTAVGTKVTYNWFKSARYIKGGLASVGLVGAYGLTGLWDYATIRHLSYVFWKKAPSLEWQIIQNYLQLSKSNPDAPKIDFKNYPWALTWDVLKTSVFETLSVMG